MIRLCGHSRADLSCLVAVLGLALFAPLAVAQSPPIFLLQYSADMGANIVGASRFAARRDYVVDTLVGNRSPVSIAGLPDRVDLKDFHIDPNGDVLFCLDIGATLGGIYFRPADVIRRSAGTFSKFFDAAAAGVPAGVHCDGVARSGIAGSLLLSFDRTFAVGGLTVRPADVIAFAGGFGAKLIDSSALGLAARLNVDAVDSIGTATDLLISFDTGGQVGGVTFADEDILQLRLSDSTWSKRFTVIGFSDRWGAANLDGLATASNADTLFNNGFE